jgi:3'-phosphoadenosine 5'-phosphosulfate sulfotransferase (PAPS reductase)/FAD synthetase
MKFKDNKNIFCSVSAGYSSVMMAIKIKEWFPDHNIVCAMANTSKERPESLDFMHKCDQYFGLDLSWIEAEFHENGRGPSYHVVNYANLKRDGEIFESGIKKLGIPFKDNKWCNRDMKLDPLKKYADDIFGKGNYSIAVGIRADEIDRVRKDYKTNNVFYPLIDNQITTKERNKFWNNQPIQIDIPAFKGNCDLCFQKSNRKLMTILEEEPEKGEWWSRMIEKYGTTPKPTSPSYNELLESNGYMSFYRGYNTIEDLVKMAEQPFTRATDEYVYESDLFDLEDACGSGCSVF